MVPAGDGARGGFEFRTKLLDKFDIFPGFVGRIDVLRTPRGPTLVTVAGPNDRTVKLLQMFGQRNLYIKMTETSTSRNKRVWCW